MRIKGRKPRIKLFSIRVVIKTGDLELVLKK
jgi:hypothetical protein